MYFSNKRSEPNFERAIHYFEDAIARDPTYSAAYSGLSNALLGQLFVGVRSAKVRERATWAAEKAIELDPLSPEAHSAVGRVREFYDWNWSGAENEYRRAIELNHNFALGHQEYALFLATQGRFDESVAEAQQSQELDPLSPFIRTTYCLDLYIARRYQAAVEKCQQALELDPNFLHAHGNLFNIYISMGQYDRAFEEYEKRSSLAGDPPAAVAAAREAYQRDGMEKLWHKELVERQHSSMGPNDEIDTAAFYSLFGETEKAFASLEKGYQQHSPFKGDLRRIRTSTTYGLTRATASGCAGLN